MNKAQLMAWKLQQQRFARRGMQASLRTEQQALLLESSCVADKNSIEKPEIVCRIDDVEPIC